MINESHLIRRSLDSSFLQKFVTYLLPDFYRANSMADYVENSPKIQRRSYIVLPNVRIKSIQPASEDEFYFFVVYDHTGEDIIYWNPKSFQDTVERDGFEDGERVHDVFLNYSVKKGAEIYHVQRCDPSGGEFESDSLLEMVWGKAQ